MTLLDILNQAGGWGCLFLTANDIRGKGKFPLMQHSGFSALKHCLWRNSSDGFVGKNKWGMIARHPPLTGRKQETKHHCGWFANCEKSFQKETCSGPMQLMLKVSLDLKSGIRKCSCLQKVSKACASFLELLALFVLVSSCFTL